MSYIIAGTAFSVTTLIFGMLVISLLLPPTIHDQLILRALEAKNLRKVYRFETLDWRKILTLLIIWSISGIYLWG